MNRRQAVLVAVAGVAVLALVAWLLTRPSRSGGRTGPAGETPTIAVPDAPEVDLQLLFPDYAGGLRTETRTIDNPGTMEAIVRRTVEELLAGPMESGRVAPFPSTIEVASVFVAADGTVFVDLASPDDAPPSSGSRQELVTVYSVVNSVLLTAPELRGVALLWNGVQRASFAGHLDTSRPLTVKRDLITG